MGRRGKRGSRQQQRVRGFRPGKEPPQLKARQAKEQLGPDASWAQKQTIDALAGKSPRQVQTMVKRWSLALVAATLLLVLLGALLYQWSVVAGIVVHVLALVPAFLWYRIRKQRQRLVEMAESLKGGKGRR